jgi:hypothetical protein
MCAGNGKKWQENAWMKIFEGKENIKIMVMVIH